MSPRNRPALRCWQNKKKKQETDTGGLVAATSAKGFHRLTDGDISKLRYEERTWYGEPLHADARERS